VDSFEALITYDDASVTMQEIKFRVHEGYGGSLHIYILPKTASKTAQMLCYELPTLSMYEKIANMPPINDYTNELRVTGAFSVSEATRWLRKALADMPDAVVHSEVSLSFMSELGTTLTIDYSAGVLAARSESVSTLMTLKETINREAGVQKGLDINTRLNPDSVEVLLKKLDRRYQSVLSSTLNLQLIEAINEMAMHDDLSNLSKEIRDIYQQKDELLANKDVALGILEYLQGVMRDLYFDWKKVCGSSPTRQTITGLERLLMNYDVASLIAYFHS
jgi:hypothetical protein